MKQRRLENKVVVITGASGGIGAATALACGRSGMKVALIARRLDGLESVAKQIRESNGEALVLSCDVTLPGALDSAVSSVLAQYGRIDVLIACAGQGLHHSTESADSQDIESLVALNYLSIIKSVKAVLPSMRSQASGHLMLFGSVVAEVMFPNDSLYSSTKAAVHRYGKGLKNELRDTGIHVTTVIPGVVETSLTEGLNGLPKADPAIVAKDILKCIAKPKPQLVTPKWYGWVLLASRLAPNSAARYIEKRIGSSSS